MSKKLLSIFRLTSACCITAPFWSCELNLCSFESSRGALSTIVLVNRFVAVSFCQIDDKKRKMGEIAYIDTPMEFFLVSR